jgi:hypothetical protein
MALIFLSYRMTTALSHAGRINDRLVRHFGQAAIFFDRSCLSPGDSWRDRIREELLNAVVVLPIIDPEWTSSLIDRLGEEDIVRVELETAIQLRKKLVPLRVGGAAAPHLQELPTLRSLLDYQFLEIDETTTVAYDASVAVLIAMLENIEDLTAPVEAEAIRLLMSKDYVAAEHLLIRQPETARQRPSLSVYLALARLAGRSFNALYPAERETIEALLRRARATLSAWPLPILLLAIMQIDYYRLHGLASPDPILSDAIRFGDLDVQSRSLVSDLNVSRRARRELQLDFVSGTTR